MSRLHEVYIGIGSNLLQPMAKVTGAVAALKAHPEIISVECSSLYRSAPLGIAEQPDFINTVCRVLTPLEPLELLRRLQRIENEFGRKRGGLRWGPRTLDLDILLYDQQLIESRELIVPHPRMHERAFVLYPLQEIAPDLVIPGIGPVASLAGQCGDQECVRIESDADRSN